MTRIEELTLNLADDVLSETEERELRALLAEGEQARQAHIRILQIEAGLRAQRQQPDLASVIMGRVRRELADSVARAVMTQIKSQSGPEWATKEVGDQETRRSGVRFLPFPFFNSRWWSFRRAPLAMAASLALFTGICVWLFGPTMGQPMLAKFSGRDVVVERGAEFIPATEGMMLQTADTLRIGTNASATITFGAEQTRLDLTADTEFKFTRASRGKRLVLDHGKLVATVARQRPFQPMIVSTPQGVARVVGTQFTLTVSTNSTRLDVTEGLVRLTRTSDEKSARVGAGQHAVAAPDFELTALPLTGGILREYWTNVPGAFHTTYLTSNTNYPDHPSGRDYLSKLETFSNWGTNYGARIRGYLLPPVSGDFTFWITAGDGGDLFLSSDDNPDHRQQIAHWEGPMGKTQQSSPVPLKAGCQYYIELLQKTGNTNSHLAVEWKGPGRDREVISGEFLSPWKSK